MTMEMDITNNYKQEKHLQDSSEQKNGLDLSMRMALDLSCKKNMPLVLPETNSTMDLSQTTHAKQYRQTNLLERDGQISIADISTMSLPYSESNSPKRMKTESMSYENSTQLKHNMTNACKIIPNVTMVPLQQPSLPMVPNETTKISVEISTPKPCTETSQSFVTDNEAERKFSTVPAECSTSTDVTLTTSSLNIVKKTPRPFKAYPKNVFSIIPPLDYNSNEDYAKFREKLLENVKKMQGNTTPNPKMRRVSKSPGLPTSTVDEKDAAYWERRRKNNEAAKRSREARRAKEDELAIRAAFLEHENAQLRNRINEIQLMYNNLYNTFYKNLQVNLI